MEYCTDDPSAKRFFRGVYQGKKSIKYYLRCIKVYVADIMAEPRCLIVSSYWVTIDLGLWPIHDNFKHLPPVPLYSTVPSRPFDTWGIDVIGAIEPPSATRHHFILADTDYFSKWAEAIPLREVKFDNVINFLE
jgi:hypothetical protein